MTLPQILGQLLENYDLSLLFISIIIFYLLTAIYLDGFFLLNSRLPHNRSATVKGSAPQGRATAAERVNNQNRIRIVKYVIILLIILMIYYVLSFTVFKHFYNFRLVEYNTLDYNSIIESYVFAPLRESDNTNNINASVNLAVNKESAKIIADGLSTGAGQIGLGAAIGGVAAAAAKTLTGAALPPLQKVALVGLAGGVGALTHVGATFLNRKSATGTTSTPSSSLPVNTNNDLPTTPRSATVSSDSSTDVIDSIVANSPFESLDILSLLANTIDLDNPIILILVIIVTLNLIIVFLLVLLSFSLMARYLVNSNIL